MLGVKEVIAAINKYYMRETSTRISLPNQIVDGGVADFVDSLLGVSYATARIRFTNNLTLNQETSQLFIELVFSDIVFSRPAPPQPEKAPENATESTSESPATSSSIPAPPSPLTPSTTLPNNIKDNIQDETQGADRANHDTAASSTAPKSINFAGTAMLDAEATH
jgi:hypothetical protein